MSCVYQIFIQRTHTGVIDPDSVTLKAMLVSASYTPDSQGHEFRSAVTAYEITAGGGYTAGGEVVTCVVTRNDVAKTIILTFEGPSWGPSATFATPAKHCIYYVARGGASSADELVICNTFSTTKQPSAASLIVDASTYTVTNSSAT